MKAFVVTVLILILCGYLYAGDERVIITFQSGDQMHGRILQMEGDSLVRLETADGTIHRLPMRIIVSISKNSSVVIKEPKPPQELPIILPTKSENRNLIFEGAVAGGMAAESDISGVGWLIGGVVCGVGVGLIGTTVITVAAALVSTNPPYQRMAEIQHEESSYRMSFISEYKSKARGRKVWPALGGGLVGTGIAVLILTSNGY